MALICRKTSGGRIERAPRGTVFLVAADEAVRHSLVSLLQAFAFSPEPYAGLEALYRAYDGRRGCLTIDLHNISADPCSCARSVLEAGIDLPLIMLDGLGKQDRVCPDPGQSPAPRAPVRVMQQPVDSLTYIATVESILA